MTSILSTSDNASVDPWPTDAPDSFIDNIAKGFTTGIGSLGSALDAALSTLESSPSDPSALAEYQALLSEYTIFRNAQSTAVQAIKTVDSTILQKFS